MDLQDYFPADWVADARELTEARRRQFQDAELFISRKRYRREYAVEADLRAYNLDTFGGIGVLYPDDFYRIAVPAGARPDTMQRHLERVAAPLEFQRIRPGEDGNEA